MKFIRLISAQVFSEVPALKADDVHRLTTKVWHSRAGTLTQSEPATTNPICASGQFREQLSKPAGKDT